MQEKKSQALPIRLTRYMKRMPNENTRSPSPKHKITKLEQMPVRMRDRKENDTRARKRQDVQADNMKKRYIANNKGAEVGSFVTVRVDTGDK